MTLRTISAQELHEKLENEELLLLDVRAEEKYNDYHIEGPNVKSVNINKAEIFSLAENKEASLDNLPKNKKIIVTCTTGNSAAKCAQILNDKAYDVVVLEGGITAWKDYLNSK